MKSQHGARFDHDEQAERFGAEIRREENPIRAGYAAALAWVVRRAEVQPADHVVDVGIGTGNLSVALPPCAHLVGVDLSRKMLALARAKLGERAALLRKDALAWAHEAGELDVLVSTFALHHLTPAEKGDFLQHALARLRPGGRLAIADLAFESARAGEAMQREWEDHDPWDLRKAVADEFYWDLAEARRTCEGLGLRVTTERFGPLIWGMSGTRADLGGAGQGGGNSAVDGVAR